jgi:hypothetical protein
MEDFQTQREKLLAVADDCDRIADLAADQRKRDTFRKLAADLRQMVADLAAAVVEREG